MTLRYYGQFDPSVDRFLHERYFSDAPPGLTLIECGAFDGEFESSGKFFEETLGWRAINIEPSPRIFQKLVQNRPTSTNLNVALADKNGVAEFHDVHYPGWELCTNGSIRHTPQHRDLLNHAGCTYETSLVKTTTYRDVIREQGIGELELLILDVEGLETEVLLGMQACDVLPRVLCVEHGQLGEQTMLDLVEPLGYQFDTISFVNSFFVRKH